MTRADLTCANLYGADLTGATEMQVRSSVGTRWPAGMAERMRLRSDEVVPGAWVVAGRQGPDRTAVPSR
ncbi:pentapeptide repeat-containing protein [Actinomadura rayongensis]|uniref:pentapeptide repeat-containing protein n=1 Tax=Actinomadura rayongensis TaxID=1429076 RepID=UPI001926BEA8